MTEHRLPIVLSLSPHLSRRTAEGADIGHSYQALCVRSWVANGFRVISVNAAAELERVAALYPDVEIVAGDRDMSALCGKPLVPLSEMVRVLRETGASAGGIVNSDVAVSTCAFEAWARRRLLHPDAVDERLDCLFMSRHETAHPFGTVGSLYSFGFDAFFFRMDAIADVELDPFTIGLPWWDYYLPMAFILNDRRVGEVEGLLLRHLSHTQKWNAANWTFMFNAFRQYCGPRLTALARRLGDDVPSLVGLLQEDAMCDFFADHVVNRRVDDPGFDQLRRYREAYSVTIADLIHQLSTGILFPQAGALAA